MARDRDPAAAWRRYKTGVGPLHDLTVLVARTIHEEPTFERLPRKSWDKDVVDDQWLAVGSWQTAEAVVNALPMVVSV